jgi:hypothetical protein
MVQVLDQYLPQVVAVAELTQVERQTQAVLEAEQEIIHTLEMPHPDKETQVVVAMLVVAGPAAVAAVLVAAVQTVMAVMPAVDKVVLEHHPICQVQQ